MRAVFNSSLFPEMEPVQLPDGRSAASVAEECRETLQGFLDGSATTWGKTGLAVWLAGPYRLLTRLAPRPEESGIRSTSDTVPASVRTQLRSDDLEGLMRSARQEVTTTLRLACAHGNTSFAHTAIHAGAVTRTRDATGRAGWVPVDRNRMRLPDRVLSLAAADYLMRPADYLTLLAVCSHCEAVSFDPQARARGACRTHATTLRKIRLPK